MFQNLARAIYLTHSSLPATSPLPNTLFSLLYALCDGCDSLRHYRNAGGWQQQPQSQQQLNRLSPFLAFSPSLHTTDVTAVASLLISAVSGLPRRPQLSRQLCRTTLRLIFGLVDFIDRGFVKHPVPNLPPFNAPTVGSKSQQDAMKLPTPVSWVMEGGCGARGDSLGQLDEALTDFCIMYAEEVTDILFSPMESQIGKLLGSVISQDARNLLRRTDSLISNSKHEHI